MKHKPIQHDEPEEVVWAKAGCNSREEYRDYLNWRMCAYENPFGTEHEKFKLN